MNVREIISFIQLRSMLKIFFFDTNAIAIINNRKKNELLKW